MKTPIVRYILVSLFLAWMIPAASAQEAAPATAPAIQVPANPEPLGDFTKYFAKRTAHVTSAGQPAALTYFWFPAQQPAEGAKYPLIVVLHNSAGIADAARYLVSETVRKEFPAFVAVPALPEGLRWAESGPVKPTHALSQAVDMVKQILAENPAADPKRVYVIGCGSGGNGAYGAAEYYSDIFATAVPISATWNPSQSSNMKNIPVAAFHGADDKISSYLVSKDTIIMIQQNGGTAYFTLFDQMGYDCSSPRIYTPQLWAWMFQQKKN